MTDRSLDDLRSEAVGRGRKGCRRCGAPTAGYFTLHVKNPHLSRAGKQIKGAPHQPAESGGTIISRSFSFCEKHLVEAWDECLEVVQ